MGLIPSTPPPGPARAGFWRSPVRSAWLTTIIGSLLLATITIVSVTGFLSHAAYQPDLGSNALVPRELDLQLFVISWPTSPSWLYAFTQGSHVTFGLMLLPLLLFKLWSVIPKLFWPLPTTPAKALEKLATLLLVGSALFQVLTGLTNAQLYYPWHFNFVVAHYYGAWIFIASVVLHVAVKFPTMKEARRTRNDVLGMAGDELRSPNPGPTTISRRGVLGLLGGATGAVFLGTVGQSAGGPLRELALFAPRGRGEVGPGARFPVNKTAKVAKITPEMVGDGWRLKITGPGGKTVELSRADLLAMRQRTYDLPIACVEGWSSTQSWTGVRLSDLAALVDSPDSRSMHVVSLQPRGAFKQTTVGRAQVADDESLLALKVGGDDLPLDHGFPARVVIPALPGVHCTKWVETLEFA
ncbi:MAG: molybdopterin-dependent oxidoreductase [Solirubrobacteraceae bacterium]|nr:molybdopterin-dependent oxidoreductase [Solirubrobacteraceae bacterium]